MDGAADEIKNMLDICAKYNIGVILVVQAARDSQNGKDSSGRATKVEWLDPITFEHWPIQTAEWVGKYNFET